MVTPFLVDPGSGKNWCFVKVETDAGGGTFPVIHDEGP